MIRSHYSDLADLNKVDSHGLVPLHWFAIINTSPDILKFLIELGADVQQKSSKGLTALHGAAAYNSNPEIISTLVDANVPIDSVSNNGLTALHGAVAYNSNPEIIKELFKSGVSIEHNTPSDLTPLHIAAANSINPEIIQILVDNGVKINNKDKNGDTPLHTAASANEKPEIIKILLELEAEVNATNSEGLSPLHLAAMKNSNPEVIQTLLSYGAMTGLTDKNGNLPYDLAKESNPNIAGNRIFKKLQTLHSDNWGSKGFFREAGVEDVERCINQGVNVVDSNKGFTPLHWAARCTKHKEVIEILLQHGAEINATEKTGLTPLHWAVQNPYIPVEIASLLVQNGGDIHVRTKNTNNNLIYTAVRNAYKGEVLSYLLGLGIPAEEESKDGIPLIHRAVTNAHCPLELLEALLDHGNDPKVVDRLKNTALLAMLKTNKINMKLLRKLISVGVDPNTQNSLGNTPLHRIVRMNSNHSAVEFLINSGADPYLPNFKGKSPFDLASESLKKHIAKVIQGNIESEQVAVEDQDQASAEIEDSTSAEND